MFHTAPGPDLGGHIRRRFLLPKGNGDEVAKISIEDSNGGIRPENQDDYRARSFIASRLEGSGGTSSVINVKDLGFSAAHQLFYGLSERESLEDAMEAAEIRGLLGLEAKSSATIKESIREEIKLRLESASGHDTEKYLPINEFNRIFGKESIKSLIKEGEICGENANLHTAIASCVTRRRILGILLYMKKLEYFEKFVRENITDDDLPLEPTRSAYEPSTLTRASKENTTLFEDWEDNDVVLFYSHQSLFFVPFFDIRDNRLCSYTLGQNIRLPWRKYELKSSGGNGVVHQVEIHPSHHNFKPARLFNKPLYFALKEIDTHDEEIYHQELVALEKTCAQIQKDSHLIKLLLTFQHGRKYYFLFEWADGNLGEYWHEHPYGPERTIEKMRWAATQCLGLATAVKRIHGLATWQKERRNQPQMLGISGREDENEWGRHGDIKPNNILWFASDGDRLVLSDLGLTRFHSSVTRSLVPHTSIAGYSWSYRAPEMDNPQQNICQKYDIWSLGCVFLEFCSWWLLGLKGIEEFWNVRVKGSQILVVDEDNYFTMTQSRKYFEAIVKPSVTEWIKRLHHIAAGDPFATGILRLVNEDMLVVDKNKRLRADVICAAIHRIVDELSQAENIEALRMTSKQDIMRPADTPKNDINMKTMLTADNLLHMHITGGSMVLPETRHLQALTLTTNSINGDAFDQASDKPSSINTKLPESHRASFQGPSPDRLETTEQPTQITTRGLNNSYVYAPSSVTTFPPPELENSLHGDSRMLHKAEGVMAQHSNIPADVNTLAPSSQQPAGEIQHMSEATALRLQESDNTGTRLSFFKAAIKRMFYWRGERTVPSNTPAKRMMKSRLFEKHAA